jgi:hypothetical protein
MNPEAEAGITALKYFMSASRRVSPAPRIYPRSAMRHSSSGKIDSRK